jgi:C4-type Zn-finger protein
MTLTEEQRKKYIEDPTHCPYCGSEEIYNYGIAHIYEKNQAWFHILCDGCKRRWNDEYSLSGIVEGDSIVIDFGKDVSDEVRTDTG